VGGVLARADSGDDSEGDKESGSKSEQECGFGLVLGEGIRNSWKSLSDFVCHGSQIPTDFEARKGKSRKR